MFQGSHSLGARFGLVPWKLCLGSLWDKSTSGENAERTIFTRDKNNDKYREGGTKDIYLWPRFSSRELESIKRDCYGTKNKFRGVWDLTFCHMYSSLIFSLQKVGRNPSGGCDICWMPPSKLALKKWTLQNKPIYTFSCFFFWSTSMMAYVGLYRVARQMRVLQEDHFTPYDHVTLHANTCTPNPSKYSPHLAGLDEKLAEKSTEKCSVSVTFKNIYIFQNRPKPTDIFEKNRKTDRTTLFNFGSYPCTYVCMRSFRHYTFWNRTILDFSIPGI